MDKATAKKLDEQFLAFQKREEANYLSKVSRFLATAWELTALMAKLGPSECLVIRGDGAIFQGHVKTDKFRQLAESLPGQKPASVDSKGREKVQQYTKSWVNCPSPAFKGCWEEAMKQHLDPKDGDEYAPIYDLFKLKLEEVMMSDPTCSQLTMKSVTDVNKLTYHELGIKGFPLSIAVGKTGKFLYFRMNGGEPVWA